MRFDDLFLGVLVVRLSGCPVFFSPPREKNFLRDSPAPGLRNVDRQDANSADAWILFFGDR